MEEEIKILEKITNYKDDIRIPILGTLEYEAIEHLVQAYKEGEAVIEEMARWIFDKDYIENSLLIHRDDYYSNCIKQVKEYFKTK